MLLTVQQHYLVQIAAVCLPGVMKSRVLGEVPVVKVHAAAEKLPSSSAAKLLSTILTIILARVEVLHIGCDYTRLVDAGLVHALASDRAGALVPDPPCIHVLN